MTDEQNIPQWAINAAIDLAGTHAGGAIEEVACIIAKHAPQPMGAEEAAETDIADVRRELREAGIEGISFEGAGELLKKLATAQAENAALRQQVTSGKARAAEMSKAIAHRNWKVKRLGEKLAAATSEAENSGAKATEFRVLLSAETQQVAALRKQLAERRRKTLEEAAEYAKSQVGGFAESNSHNAACGMIAAELRRMAKETNDVCPVQVALCADEDLDALWDGIESLVGYDSTVGCAQFIRLASEDIRNQVATIFRDQLGGRGAAEAWFIRDGSRAVPDLRRIANPDQLRLACAHRALAIAIGRSHKMGGDTMYSRLRDYHESECKRAMASLVLTIEPGDGLSLSQQRRVALQKAEETPDAS